MNNVMNMDTAVPEKELPAVPEAKLVNAPENLEDAIQKLMEAEMRLEDLARACEIAAITRQFEIMEAFKDAADEYLLTKVQIEQPDTGDIKVTVVTGELDPNQLNTGGTP
jgi:predicted transcriptional regulator